MLPSWCLPFVISCLVLSACGGRTGLDFGLLAEQTPAPSPSPDTSDDAGGDDSGPRDATPAGSDDSGLGGAAPTEGDDSGLGDSAPAGGDDSGPRDAALCDYGTLVGNVSGQTTYFAGSVALPAGRYQLAYVDGCMMYSSGGQGWTVDAYTQTTGTDEWYLVGASGTPSGYPEPPGVVGFLIGQGAYADFDACVAASLASPPVTFDFPGGPLGVWLSDNPYTDNVSGIDGRNPTWRLTCAP